ncbi:MAG: ribonuclease HI family protein [Candidatus Dojkabacteria bacterium]|nr:MAG: ribonuclease HI family protein [Candidatus Dojkabacteria bacterium]
MLLLYTDGGSRGNPGPAAIGAVLYSETQQLLDFTAEYKGVLTNNQAEYLGLLAGLGLANKHANESLTVYMDSELVVKQMKGEYKVKHPDIIPLKAKVDSLLVNFSQVNFVHIERAKNKFADKLVNIALDSAANA